MENRNSLVPVAQTGGASGRGLATEPAPVDVPDKTWYVVEGGIKTNPTFTITITARQTILIRGCGVEVEIDRFGLGIKDGISELIVDPRYDIAELKRNGKLVAISSRVRYRPLFGPEREVVYSAREFAELVKTKVKELIAETVNITAFS